MVLIPKAALGFGSQGNNVFSIPEELVFTFKFYIWPSKRERRVKMLHYSMP